MEVTVNTKYGAVRGRQTDGVTAFKGIPYAAPPYGANRMRPPAPPVPWDGVRPAFDYGPTARKPPAPAPLDTLVPEVFIPGEDCLNLNVWTPDPGSSGMPVMVWIHGGGFETGSGSMPRYDGSRFARDGVVCVTINYRLGVEGFLYLGDGISNLGIQDQRAALRWVQENIAAFGGDPAQVTIFGESAGGMSVTALLSMPSTRGLFRRVIAQSGASGHVLSPATATRVGGHLAELLGVPATREAIASVPLDKLLEAQVQLSANASIAHDPLTWGEVVTNIVPFEPVIDGETLLARPLDALAAGAGAGIDVITGYTADEFRLLLVPAGNIDLVDDAYLGMISKRYGLSQAGLASYRAAYPGATAGEVLAALSTDWHFRIPAIRLAETQSKSGGATYMYEFAWHSPLYEGRLRACHALELAFVFDTLNTPGVENLTGKDPPQSLADDMHARWVSFARSGDPGWPRYDTQKRTTMRFDVGGGELASDPGGHLRALWEGIR